jgi:MFS family permease
MTGPDAAHTEDLPAPPVQPVEIRRLRDLSPEQWKSGIAAWLGWLFDGLDMHLYGLVATPFVADLLGIEDQHDPRVGYYSSLVMAAFLIGWALGGSFFGRVADRIGRSRGLMLTILVYAGFTGLSYFAHTWWELLIYRFLAALGIGGEWAVGASLLSETWPRHWRPWLAAVLQTGVNIGVLLANGTVYVLSPYPTRTVFLVGVLPALLVLWIRQAVPEPEEWQAARDKSEKPPPLADLFRGNVRRTTILTLLVCGLSLTAHWAFLFWYVQHLRTLPELDSWTDEQKSRLVGTINTWVVIASIVGNFFAGWLARRLTYRRAISALCVGYFVAIVATFCVARGHADRELWVGVSAIGVCQGVFALFTMYLPPLFPTLLRSTGAGFCYNFGRVAAGVGTVVFGLTAPVGEFRMAIVYAGFLFLPAAVIAWMMPEAPEERLADPIEPLE